MTAITASGPTSPALAATQPGTRLINFLVAGGAGGGGFNHGWWRWSWWYYY